MTITVEIRNPGELAKAILIGGNEPARAVLEAVALEGYRRDLLSEEAVRRLLGFETCMEVHGFLKEHGVFLHYTLDDLEHDMQEARRYGALENEHRPCGLRAE